jgi:predicted membrane channel-forming protein YqfA (hemolysin III family)
MSPRTKSSLLWGLVGVLAFLVLVQGYRLVVGSPRIDALAVGGVALLVGAAAAGATYALEPRLNGRS